MFAPEGSYHAESATKNGWGYVVSEDSPAALAATIVKVVTDRNLARGLVQAALQEAQSRTAKRHAARLHDWVLADTEKLSVCQVALERKNSVASEKAISERSLY